MLVPHDWTPARQEAELDPWPDRIHLALLSGRIDLVAVSYPPELERRRPEQAPFYLPFRTPKPLVIDPWRDTRLLHA